MAICMLPVTYKYCCMDLIKAAGVTDRSATWYAERRGGGEGGPGVAHENFFLISIF